MAPKRNYSKEQMAKAIEEVRRGIKVGVAAAKYGVPRITLRNKITGRSPIDCSFGPATILSAAEEKLLAQWLFLISDSHFPVTKDHLLDSVQKIITEKNIDSCPFKDNRPGKKWFTSFLKRHPEISERTAQNLTKARDGVTEDELKQWFETTSKYIEEQGLLDILDDPNRIFNTDESAFYLQPKTGKVLVRKGEKNVYNSAGDEKENLTVLLTANAAGVLAPPMIVFPYERLPTLIVNSVPTEWSIGRSETGWMCARTFFEYVTNVFNPWLEKHNVPKPVLFFLDGHRSHMTLHLAKFCKENGIEIIALYPNSTHLIQPMDVAVFRPLKIFWKNQIQQWKIEHPGQRLKKEDFAPNLETAVKKVTKETIKNGFRKSGLHPFSVDYVDLTKLKSQSRTSIRTAETTENAFHFLTFLESEIKTVFSVQKLNLFNELFYKNRTEIEDIIPEEDQSLYIIWAKLKHTLTGTESENVRREELIVTEDLPEQLSVQNSDEPLMPLLTDSLKRNNVETTEEPQPKITDEPQQPPKTQQQTTKDSQPPVTEDPQPLITDEPQFTIRTEEVKTQFFKDAQLPTGAVIEHQITDDAKHSFTTEFVTPVKAVSSRLNNTPCPSTSAVTSLKNMVIPSPFKRALFWPEQDVKKRRTKELIPSAITSDCWMTYVAKKENEKKRLQEEKERRIKERQEKKVLKENLIKEKKEKRKNQVKKSKTYKKQNIPSSSSEGASDIEYQESEYDVQDEFDNDSDIEDQLEKIPCRRKLPSKKPSASGSENIPLEETSNAIQKGKYVIIVYEGEYFPGIVENIDGADVEVSTMTLSKGNTFRWPDIPDKIWYKKYAIVENIENPVLINKRGFYKVKEMLKYLPFIS